MTLNPLDLTRMPLTLAMLTFPHTASPIHRATLDGAGARYGNGPRGKKRRTLMFSVVQPGRITRIRVHRTFLKFSCINMSRAVSSFDACAYPITNPSPHLFVLLPPILFEQTFQQPTITTPSPFTVSQPPPEWHTCWQVSVSSFKETNHASGWCYDGECR